MILYAIIVFITGLAIGSFLNVVIFRIDDLKSILNTRSHCLHCQKHIKWYDLIPLFSFVILRGKCRSCGKRLSPQYPLVEGATALAFLLLLLKFGISWALVFYALVFCLLIVIFVDDVKTQFVADILSWPLLIICIAGGWFFGHFGLLDLVLGVLIGGGILALLVVISREKWMGAGDIFIGSALGALLGYPRAILLIFFSFVIGSLIGLLLIAFKKKGMKDAVPFTPFLIIAALIALFYGSQIIDWYLGFTMLG